MSGEIETTQQSLKWFSQRKLVRRSQSVDHMPYCNVGYRPPNQPLAYYLASAFHPTNETLNIWTHLLPLLYFVHRYTSRFVADGWEVLPYMMPFYAHGLAVCIMLLASTVAHIFNAAAESVHRCCFAADHSCIFTVIFAFLASLEHYSCELDHYCRWPLTLFSVRMNEIVMVLCFWGHLFARDRKFGDLFTAAASFIVLFVGGLRCFVRLFGGTQPRSEHLSYYGEFRVDLFVWGSCFGFLAVFFYSLKIPERFSPDTFAIVGNSHHFLHVFISGAMYMQSETNLVFVNSLKENMNKRRIPDSAFAPGLWYQSFSGVLTIAGLSLLGIIVDWQMRKRKETKKNV